MSFPFRTLLHSPLVRCLFAGILVWEACQKNDFENLEIADSKAEFAFPLFRTTLSMRDLAENLSADSSATDSIAFNADKSITLFYASDVVEKPASDIFKFLEAGILPVNDTFYYAPFNAPDSLTIKKAVLSSGAFNLFVSNSLKENIKGVFYIPQMTKNGVSLSIPFDAPPTTQIPYISLPVDVNGWTLISDDNRLLFRYEARLSNGERIKIPDVIPGTGGIGLVFQNMKFKYVEGYWGNTAYPLTLDTIDIDINQSNLQGNVQIKDPEVTVRVNNSFGFPTRGVVKVLHFIGKNGETLPLKSSLLDNDGIDFAYPSLKAGEVGQTKYTTLRFNSQNSNIAQIFNAQPVKLIYEVAGIANAEKDPNLIGFIEDKSKISMSVAVALTLEGAVKDFRADQTLDLNFGDFTDIDSDKIESVEFKLVTENRIPVATRLQIYFQDAQGAPVDSLFERGPQQVMEAAAVNSAGETTGARRAETFIPMDAARFERIRQLPKAALAAWFTTSNGGLQPVKIRSDQDAVVKMGVRVKSLRN